MLTGFLRVSLNIMHFIVLWAVGSTKYWYLSDPAQSYTCAWLLQILNFVDFFYFDIYGLIASDCHAE